jgi:RNA polymerase sigma-70 factor (ECF subfamily)
MNKEELGFELAVQCKVGDKDAFNELFLLYQSDVERFINQRIRDEFAAEDLSQEVFIKAWDSIAEYDGTCAVETWLCSIAKHTLLNHLRDQSRRPNLKDVSIEQYLDREEDAEIDRYVVQQLDNEFTTDNGPDLDLEAAELFELIQDNIDLLDEKYQVLYNLRYVKCKDYSEISEELGLPVGTVGKRLHELNLVLEDFIKDLKS